MEFDCKEIWEKLSTLLSTEFFACIAAGISGIVAVKQYRWNKKHNEELMVWNKKNQIAVVRPYITDFLNVGDNNSSFEYSLLNKGLGPALLNSYELTWHGKKIRIEELHSILCQKLGELFFVRYTTFDSNFALSPNEGFEIIKITINESMQTLPSNAEKLLSEVVSEIEENARFQVHYKSIMSEELITHDTGLNKRNNQ